MVREFVISIYLFLFQWLFNVFKLFPQKKKTVCVASFGDNIFYTVRAIRERSNEEIIILKDRSCQYRFDESISKVLPFDLRHPMIYLQSIYHLATASTILIDNYFGFLAATNFRKSTHCIQLWHAVGAIKKFGLQNPANQFRAEKALKRFKKVYSRFHYIIVGSENMVNIFKDSFGIKESAILRTGIPRTDLFYDLDEQAHIYQQMTNLFSLIKRKKVILYAPTYRPNQFNQSELPFNLNDFYHAFKDEYVLLIKHHPSVSFQFHNKYADFVINASEYYDINHLLLVTDILITDYSSVAFEFALLERPMIFYAYDINEYEHHSGLIEHYKYQMPGPIVDTTEELIQIIQKHSFDFEKIRVFKEEWNQYSKGNSSDQLADLISKMYEEKQEKVYI